MSDIFYHKNEYNQLDNLRGDVGNLYHDFPITEKRNAQVVFPRFAHTRLHKLYCNGLIPLAYKVNLPRFLKQINADLSWFQEFSTYWSQMVGFQEIFDSACFEKENKNLIGQRYAYISRKTNEDDADLYYGKSGLDPQCKFGDGV